MNSKIKSNLLLSILLMSLLATFTIGCSKDDNQPIQLHYGIYNDSPNPVIGNQVSIRFPTSEKTQLVIFGGDGNFTVTNSNEKIITVSTNNREIAIMPLTTGNSVVTIADKSNSYTLSVKVDYRTIDMKIDKQDVIVIGDKLSEIQKAEIQQKAILTLPVKVNGGFKFIYNNDKDLNKGQVFIYKDNYDINAVESVFEFKRIEIEINGFIQTHPVYVITIDGKQREFIVNKYVAPQSKSYMIVPTALNEDITGQFKTEYPDVEFVYTQQRIK